ncbi:MAG: hypothetical protein HF967_00450, partial [Methanosarcinales archaeon]|nr:hypothetical protein [Methanosarcinales archaeon]
KSNLEKSINSIEKYIISNFATKNEVSKINENLTNKLSSLEQLQDQSMQLVEDELDDLFKQLLSHKKSIHALHSQLHKDEDIMSTHQEVVDVSNVLKEMLKKVQKNISYKSTKEHQEFIEKIEALLETERERQNRLDELNKKVKKTYSQKQLDSAFDDVANEVERVKLHEDSIHKDIEQKIDNVLKKEKRDTKKIIEDTTYLKDHTTVEYLKQQLTQKIEDEISKIKADQESHLKEILELQAEEKRIDTVEDFIGFKEEELEKKLAAYYEDLEKARERWEEFFSGLKAEDEASLHKALQQIGMLRTEVKDTTAIISKYQKDQGPLKQYFVDKYNSVVDAFHQMQKETFDFQNQLKHSQEEKVAEYVNAFVQRVLDYEQKLKDAQEVISQYLDMKTSDMYSKFEGDMSQYKEFYGSEFQSIQEKVVQYLKDIEEEKNTFSSLIKNYVVQIDSKIEEVNDLEANLENTIKDAKVVINSYIEEKTEEIDSRFLEILQERTDSFMRKEENLLSSYNEKVTTLSNNVNDRLDSIEHKFIEKNTKKVVDVVETEFAKTKHLITELKDIREEVFKKEQTIEETLIDATSEFEKQKLNVIETVTSLNNEAKEHYLNLEEEASRIKSEVSEISEERMTRFEQHLNKRYLETEQKITEVKRILVDEIEGFMKDISQKVQINERKIQAVFNNPQDPQQSLQNSSLQIEDKSDTNIEVKFLEIENELKLLKANQEGIVTEQVLTPKLDSVPQPPFKKNIEYQLQSNPSIVSLYDEVQDLKANLEAINAQTTLQNINSDDSKPSQEEFLMSEILSLKEEINFLKSQNEITNAQLDLGNKLNDLPKSKRVDALIDKVAQVEMNQQKMKADIEATKRRFFYYKSLLFFPRFL